MFNLFNIISSERSRAIKVVSNVFHFAEPDLAQTWKKCRFQPQKLWALGQKTLKNYKRVLKKPTNDLNQRKSPKISKKKLAKTITGPKKLALMFLHNLRVFPSLLGQCIRERSGRSGSERSGPIWVCSEVLQRVQ